MDIQESKELSFDTQDFPKEVWVFDADNLDQGTEISHLMMSHAEEYTKDELLVICRKAAMVIDQLRTDLTKAQAVPEGFVLVKKELPEQIAEKMAIDRIDKPRHENDPVWSEIAEQSYKDQVKSKKWEFWRDYKAMIEAQEPAK